MSYYEVSWIVEIYAERLALHKHERATVQCGGWRVAFAFDTKRKADDRFDAHLARLKKGRK
jgi:hypothetical protein